MPKFLKKKGLNQIHKDSKDIHNIIGLRRLEYNDYIKSLKNKPKPKPQKLTKPKVYDINKVYEIQKISRGFQTRDINQIINRLKVNLCSAELFCLVLKDNFYHAAKRISFQALKLYYHEAFTKIDNEIDFSDRIDIKLSSKYYNSKTLNNRKKRKLEFNILLK